MTDEGTLETKHLRGSTLTLKPGQKSHEVKDRGISGPAKKKTTSSSKTVKGKVDVTDIFICPRSNYLS